MRDSTATYYHSYYQQSGHVMRWRSGKERVTLLHAKYTSIILYRRSMIELGKSKQVRYECSHAYHSLVPRRNKHMYRQSCSWEGGIVCAYECVDSNCCQSRIELRCQLYDNSRVKQAKRLPSLLHVSATTMLWPLRLQRPLCALLQRLCG